MAFTGLLNKLKNTVKATKLASGLALGSLASLIGANDTEAQTTPLLNFNFTLHDSNGQNVTSGSTVNTGQTYTALIGLNVPNTSTNNIDISSVSTSFSAMFGGAANSSNVTFQYTPASPPQNTAGAPATDDIFNGSATMSNNSYNIANNGNNVTFDINRSTNTGPFNSLSNSGTPTLYVGTFTFTVNSTAAGGNLSFNYLTGEGNTQVVSGPNFGGFGTFTNGTDLSFMDGSNNFQINFAAVPEPSTYALITGGVALMGAAALRRRRKLMQANGKMYEASGKYENGRDVITVRQIGNIGDDRQ